MQSLALKFFLDKKVMQYSTPEFIEEDPIAVPHRFSKLQDIEIAGFFAALFAWGRRSLVLKKTNTLLDLMDNDPHAFITQHEEKDLKRFLGFVHRTFNATDILYFISFLRKCYAENESLESAFLSKRNAHDTTTENALNAFYHAVFEDENHPKRTQKHIAAPFKKSACKRLNMFLRWMVRSDKEGIDFGIWENIDSSQLIIPMDVHVSRVAARLKLLPPDSKANWNTATLLTEKLKEFDADDPVKYDYALFGLGVMEKFR